MMMPIALTNLLSQPEYVHLLLNPLPIYGLITSLVGLAVALAAVNV